MCPGGDPRQRREAAPVGLRLAHQHQRGGTIVDAGGISCGDGTAIQEGGPSLVMASMIASWRICSSASIVIEPLRVWMVDRGNLVGEASSHTSGRCFLLGG